MIKSKALILDIETSPMLAYIWELGEQRVNINQIHTDWYIMAWSAKWLGESKKSIQYYDTRNTSNDKEILKPLWNLLNEADIVITQNGQKFDSRKINARFMLNNMTPPKPYLHLDTYRIVKRVAAHTSNKLQYLTEKLCTKYQKTAHSKYQGLRLWIECLNGNISAWKEMKYYNIQDVLSTEELYLKIKAWAPESMPKIYPLSKDVDTCHTCGYKGSMIAGRDRIKNTGVYVQNRCPKCGAWQILKKRGSN